MDATLRDAELSYEIIDENELTIIRAGETNIGTLKQTYKFTQGSPADIELELTTNRDVQTRFVWRPGGIDAASELKEQNHLIKPRRE